MAQPSMTHRQAFVLYGKRDTRFVIQEAKEPEPGDLDVVVSPKKTGICGSDVHMFKHGHVGDYRVESPMVLGHESAGIVVRVGRKVAGLQPGDRVAMEPGETANITSVRTWLPELMTLEDGAMIEPLAVAVHAVTRIGELRGNQNVIVFGAGPVGLLAMATCRALSARRIVAVDVLQKRLDFARQYAATDIWKPVAKEPSETMPTYSKRNAREMCGSLGLNEFGDGNDGVDLVVECAGAEACIQTGIHAIKSGGTIVQVGVGSEHPTVPLITFVFKELKYRGSSRYGPGVYQLAMDLVVQGKIDLKPLVTHRYAFEDADKAFQAMVENKGYDGKPPIKVIIDGPEAADL